MVGGAEVVISVDRQVPGTGTIFLVMLDPPPPPLPSSSHAVW